MCQERVGGKKGTSMIYAFIGKRLKLSKKSIKS